MALKQCIVQFLNGFKDSLFGIVKFVQRQKLLAHNLAAAAAAATPLPPNGSAAAAAGSAGKHAANKTSTKYNDKLYQRLFQSCILNGIFLLFCIIKFNFVLMPILNWMAFRLISERYHNAITDYLNPLIQLLFGFVWILPVFLLSKIFNLLVHQEIADIAYEQKYGKPRIYQKFSLAQVIADNVFSCTMELIFLVQSSFVNLVPLGWLTQVLCHVHLSFLYSLYAFEYKLCNMSWDIKARINYIESRWPYYFGYGLSLSLIVSAAGSYIYSATLFASVFPAFILSAIEADSERLKPIVYYRKEVTASGVVLRPVPLTLPLFRPSLYLTDFLFKLFAKKQQKEKQTSLAATSAANANSSNRYPVNRAPQASFTIRKTN